MPAEVAFAADPDLSSEVKSDSEAVACLDLHCWILCMEWCNLDEGLDAIHRIKLPVGHAKLSPFWTATSIYSTIVVDYYRVSCSTGNFDYLLILEGVAELRYGVVPRLLLLIAVFLHPLKESTIRIVTPSEEAA